MASTSALPGARAEHRSLSYWMNRVLKELDQFRKSPTVDGVHDLRVAIRRCRSVAGVLQEVDPSDNWREMRSLPKKLFRALGELRDEQIMDNWVKEHGAENDKLRLQIQESFESKEPRLLEEALRAAEKFDGKSWRRLQRKLAKRVGIVPLNSLAAQCLAVERLEEARTLHAHAKRSRRPTAWHHLRIGVKKFRYTTEILLPEKYAAWSSNLKRLQDILGEVHDLDVLVSIARHTASQEAAAVLPEWERMIEHARSERLGEYRELTQGKHGSWQEWRQALPQGNSLQAAAMARLRATARAADAHPRRTACVSLLSAGIFDALRRTHVTPLFADRNMRKMLRAAARLSGVEIKDDEVSRQKATQRYLRSLPVPPSWTAKEWDLMAWAVRYHRGSEPENERGRFAALPENDRKTVFALSGILRLARGLRKCGVQTSAGIRAEKSLDAITLSVPGLEDSVETAARLAAAKHLLDAYLEKPLIIKTVPVRANLIALPSPQAPPAQISSAASD